MRRWLLVLAALLPNAWSLSCPTAYTDGNNGYCYKPYPNAGAVTREVASQKCYNDGGRLPQIGNGFTNNFLNNMASSNSMSSVWTGLICQTDLKTSCQFEGAPTPLNSSSYSNFDLGYPDLTQAPYGYLNVNTGKWHTAGYKNLSYICEVPKGDPAVGCSDGYWQNGNSCYRSVGQMNVKDTESLCQGDGAHIASIHSDEENNYVLGTMPTTAGYYWIGLVSDAKNNLSWTDGSSYDYNNFGVQNSKYGKCVAVATNPNIVGIGQWISSNCNNTLPAKCKKDTETAYEPIDQPVLSPKFCNNSQILNGGGTIYSNNYPLSFNTDPKNGQNCYYVLTGNHDIVTISFTQVNFGGCGSIRLYNDVTGGSPPFEILDGSMINYSGRSYSSTGPVMKVVFSSCGNNYSKYGVWSAFYY